MANTKQNQKGKTSGAGNKESEPMYHGKQKAMANTGAKASRGADSSGKSSKFRADNDDPENVDVEDNETEEIEADQQSGL